MLNSSRTSVVMVSYNSIKFIKENIFRLTKQSRPVKEIIIVDNNSSDDTIGWIKSNYPKIETIKLKSNIGFSGGMNAGIKKASGEYILCLNPDVYLTDTYIEILEDMVDQDKTTGIVMGKLFNMATLNSKSKIIDSMGGVFSFYRLRYWEPELGMLDNGNYNKIRAIFWATGSACLIRKQALDKITIENEYFDEDFFMQCEDLDVSWRIKNRGWKIKVNPNAIAYHYREGNSPDKGLGDKLKWRNLYLTMIKNLPLWFLVVNFIPILMLETLRLLKNGFRNRDIINYKAEAIRLFPRMIRKRYRMWKYYNR